MDIDNDLFAKYSAEMVIKKKQLDFVQKLQADGHNMAPAIQGIQSAIKEITDKINNMYVPNNQSTTPVPSMQNPQPSNLNYVNAPSIQQQESNQQQAMNQRQGFLDNTSNQPSQGQQSNLAQQYGPNSVQNQLPPNSNIGGNQLGQKYDFGNQSQYNPTPPNQFNLQNNTQSNQSQYNPTPQNQFNPQNNSQSNQYDQSLNPNQRQQNNMAQNIGGQNQNQFNLPPQVGNAPFQGQPQSVAPPNNQFNFEQYNAIPKTHDEADKQDTKLEEEIEAVGWPSGDREHDKWNQSFTIYAINGDMSKHPGRHPKGEHEFNKDEDEFCEQYRKAKNIVMQ